MRSIRVTRIHLLPFRRWRGFDHLRLRGLSRKLLLLLWAALSVAFAFLPNAWSSYRARRAWNAWASAAHQTAHSIGKHWVQPLHPVPFTFGDERPLRLQLAADPLVQALVDPTEKVVWVREGDRLRLAPPGKATDQVLEWAREATQSGQAEWRPTFDPYRLPLEEAVLLLPVGRWCTLKRWRPESPEVERFLEGILGSHSRLRFGLVDSGEHLLQTRDTPEASGSHLLQTGFTQRPSVQPLSPWSLQVPLTAGLGRHGSGYYCLKKDFGWGWMGLSLMSPQEEASQDHLLLFHRGLGWLVYGLWFVGSLAGVLLFQHARQRERLEADRLASLTHSLKTPLTILKLRCDTVRSTELPREKQEATLLQIGEEVDQLVRLIECGLERTRPAGPTPSMEPIAPSFFDEVREEMHSTFEADHRILRIRAEAPPFRAPVLALKSALATLLENALLHGRGIVSLESRREKRRTIIRVSDEGPGIPSEILAALVAKRIQALPPERQGRGQGLGLFLLTQMAEREGWGIRFEYEEVNAFSALLEIPD